MKYLALFVITFTFANCRSNKNLELEILTQNINCLDIHPGQYKDFLFQEQIIPQSQTVVTYKLSNNTDTSYYFNIADLNNNEHSNDHYIQIDKAFIVFSTNDGNLVNVRSRIVNEEIYSQKSNKNFVINSHETLYFNSHIVLPYGTLSDDINYSVVLDNREEYSAELFLNSDGNNYMQNIGITDLKKIEENGYKVYDGIIKSKNKIPIVFNKLE